MSTKKGVKTSKTADLCHKIKVAMADQEIKRITFAQELGVNRSAITAVLNGHAKSKRILEHMVKRLGIKAKRGA